MSMFGNSHYSRTRPKLATRKSNPFPPPVALISNGRRPDGFKVSIRMRFVSMFVCQCAASEYRIVQQLEPGCDLQKKQGNGRQIEWTGALGCLNSMTYTKQRYSYVRPESSQGCRYAVAARNHASRRSKWAAVKVIYIQCERSSSKHTYAASTIAAAPPKKVADLTDLSPAPISRESPWGTYRTFPVGTQKTPLP